MFLFGWLKRDWRPKECSLYSKFFYLSIVSRITLSLAVNFQRSALHDLVTFLQYFNVKNTLGGSITFSKVSLQIFLKCHSSMGVFHVF